MSNGSEDVLGGAAQGAAVGSVAGPVGTVVGAAIGAIGGYFTAKGKRKAKKRERGRVRRAQRLLSPEGIQSTALKFRPQFKELVAGGVGPLIEQRIAANLARSGFEGTGAGEAIRGLSLQLPGAIAARESLAFAQQTNRALAESILGNAAETPTVPNIIGALAGGLQGGLGTFLAGRRSPQPTLADLRARFPSISAPAPGLPPAPQSRFVPFDTSQFLNRRPAPVFAPELL